MHLKKCFEGIAKLRFDDDLEVLEIRSVSDEVIPLVTPISTIKARGQVDKWLAELEIQMRLSLRQQIKDALKVLYCINDSYYLTYRKKLYVSRKSYSKYIRTMEALYSLNIG